MKGCLPLFLWLDSLEERQVGWHIHCGRLTCGKMLDRCDSVHSGSLKGCLAAVFLMTWGLSGIKEKLMTRAFPGPLSSSGNPSLLLCQVEQAIQGKKWWHWVFLWEVAKILKGWLCYFGYLLVTSSGRKPSCWLEVQCWGDADFLSMDVDPSLFLNKELFSAVATESGDLHWAGGVLQLCI